jgi:hypothetical protein
MDQHPGQFDESETNSDLNWNPYPDSPEIVMETVGLVGDSSDEAFEDCSYFELGKVMEFGTLDEVLDIGDLPVVVKIESADTALKQHIEQHDIEGKVKVLKF